MPHVSVIIPAWNAAEFLPSAVDSVLAQSFDDFEVIVVYDGSPDTAALERVIAYRSDPRVRYLVQENQARVARGTQASWRRPAGTSRSCIPTTGGRPCTSPPSWSR
jgi:glycosyltransferase involved in cell wall biosynthesis